MQAGGVTTQDTYNVSGRVLIDGTDIGADVETVSLGRDIPSGLPGDGGFTSATGRVTATWGDDVSDRVDHPWSVEAQDPPQITYEWTGGRNASPSEKYIGDRLVARNLMPSPRIVDASYSQSNVEIIHDAQDLPNLVITAGGGTSYVGRNGIDVVAGQWFATALSFQWGDGVGRVRHQIQFRGSNNESIESPQIQRDRSNHPTGGRSVLFAQVPDGAVEARWYSWFYLEGSFMQAPDGSTIRVGKYSAAIADTEQGAIAQVADFFDGDTPNPVAPSRPVWPPRPNAQVEVVLSDGTNEWTQFKGVIVDPSGSTSTRTISFGVRDNYRSLDRLVTIPALSRSMPSPDEGNHQLYVALYSSWLTDHILRQCGRYATPPFDNQTVVSATFQGSTWPERGTITYSQKQEPDDISGSFPNWEHTNYGRAVNNVDTLYTPNVWSGTLGGGRVTSHPIEITQEILGVGGSSTFVRAFFPGGGQLALAQSASSVVARYYRANGTTADVATLPREALVRATVRFSWSNGTLTGEVRGQTTDGSIVSSAPGTVSASELSGVINQVRAHGLGTQGAFQVAFPSSPWSKLSFTPNAVLHIASGGTNHLQGFPTQVNVNALDLLNGQADAEFAQWWIDEHDVLQWWDRGMLAQQRVAGVLTGADHVQELSWSHDHDSARHQVHVQYKQAEATTRWRTNLTLWQGGSNTLGQGDEDETFVNTPNDEIWLGVHYEDLYRYGAGTSSFWPRLGIGTVVGGIAVDEDGNERRTNTIIVTLERLTDAAYKFSTRIGVLGADEQVALQFPDEPETDTGLWRRWLGENLPILRGKKLIKRVDETATSSITGPSSAPDYTHEGGDWIDTATYAGLTADYAAASLTQPRPKITGLDIMPVLALQVGDHIRVTMPDVAELELTGVVTSNNLDADLEAGIIQQSINITPTNVASLARRWEDFGTVYGGTPWQTWAQSTANDTWADFGATPLD